MHVLTVWCESTKKILWKMNSEQKKFVDAHEIEFRNLLIGSTKCNYCVRSSRNFWRIYKKSTWWNPQIVYFNFSFSSRPSHIGSQPTLFLLITTWQLQHSRGGIGLLFRKVWHGAAMVPEPSRFSCRHCSLRIPPISAVRFRRWVARIDALGAIQDSYTI